MRPPDRSLPKRGNDGPQALTNEVLITSNKDANVEVDTIMKQDIRSNPMVKAITLLLVVACAVGAVFSWIYCGYYWDSLFDEEDFTSSVLWSQAANDKYSQLMECLEAYDAVRRGQTLGYLEQKNYDARLATLAPSATNFRYIVRDDATGEILLSTSGEDSLEFVSPVWESIRTTTPGNIYYNYRHYDEVGDITIFYSNDGGIIGQVAGYASNLYAEGETYHYAIEYGIDTRGEVQDQFWEVAHTYYSQGDIRILYLACGLTAAVLIGLVFLMCCAGRRRGAEEFTPNWMDKIPYDLYLCVLIPALATTFVGGAEILFRCYWYVWSEGELVLMNGISGLCLTGAAILTEAVLMSTATRIKTHTLLRNTLCRRCLGWGKTLLLYFWQSCCAAARSVGMMVGNLPLTGRVIGFFGVYLLVNFFLALGLFESYSTGVFLIFLCLFNGGVLFAICRWTVQWAVLRQGAGAILSGRPQAHIDTGEMRFFPDLRSHAESLNDMGGAIATAVDEQLRSERMKAELITNVSHDLKTPLTSIINYVDLLKKEDIQEEKAREYIEVLDRKSQRLKKLTEDLVEASKASTGTLTVNAERLGVVQLVEQALGEYSAKFENAGLTLVSTLPPEEVYVRADGRHLWRILDNLMGNCVKYALSGTRVYLEVVKWDGNVIFSLKNISANQLNVPPEELMERFVRGDESRTTEGSGLGLSIARSLTDLQGGTFRLSIDGDLFKAAVSFPEAK